MINPRWASTFLRKSPAHTPVVAEAYRLLLVNAVADVKDRGVVDLVRDDVKAMVEQRDDDSAPTEAVVQLVAGASSGYAMLWAGGKLRLSVEEVNQLFRRLAMPAVKTTLS